MLIAPERCTEETELRQVRWVPSTKSWDAKFYGLDLDRVFPNLSRAVNEFCAVEKPVLEQFDMKLLQALQWTLELTPDSDLLTHEKLVRGVVYGFDNSAQQIERNHTLGNLNEGHEHLDLDHLAVFGKLLFNPSHDRNGSTFVRWIGTDYGVRNFLRDSFVTESMRIEAAAQLFLLMNLNDEFFVESSRSRFGEQYAHPLKREHARLRKLAWERPADVRQIVEIANFRRVSDPRLITDVIDHENQPLQYGVL